MEEEDISLFSLDGGDHIFAEPVQPQAADVHKAAHINGTSVGKNGAMEEVLSPYTPAPSAADLEANLGPGEGTLGILRCAIH